MIIILAAAVILTISKNNPVESAKEATFKEDLRAFQDDLALTISKEYTSKQGQRDEKITTSDYNEIKEKIPSFTEKYKDKFIIENDKIIGTDELTEKEKKWAEELNISTYGTAPFDAKKWDADATPEECFEWEGTVIIGINTDKLTDRTKLRIPSKCTGINPKYVSNYESYRSFMPELQEIEIPETVTTIGDYAFHNAQGIKNIVIPNSVTSIGNEAFSYCTNLESVTIGNSVTSIGSGAFQSCSSLTSITIPDSVTSIDYYAFAFCISLTSITIPDSVTSIGDNAFYYCTNLASITILEGVTSIGSGAFESCSSLTSITIPNSVTSVGERAFWGCRSLANITFSDSVTSIGDYAFPYCTNLTSVTIPEGVTSIGSWEFLSCSSLTSVTIPASVTSIKQWAFANCSSLKNINFKGTMNDWNNIIKDSIWKENSAIVTITCTDGTITL